MNYLAKVVRRGVVLLALVFCFAAVSVRAQGTGLTGQYFDNSNFTALVTTRVDTNINFNWGTGAPSGTGITSGDTFSVIWTGQLAPQFTESYVFYVTADDVARLWVNDQLVALRAFAQGTNEMVGQIRLVAGQKVNIRLEYAEYTGSAFVKLEWASASQPRQVIPTAQLYPARVGKAGGSLLVEHWYGITNSTIASLTSNTNYPNQPNGREFVTTFECLATNWSDNYGTRVTGYIVPPVTGNYTFAVSGDQVVQLSLSTNDQPASEKLIASNTVPTAFRQWNLQPSQQSAAIPLVQYQRYYVELLHKASTGNHHWSVGWMKPGDTNFSVVPGSALVQAGLDRAQPAQVNIFDTIARDHPRLYATDESFARLRTLWQSPVSTPAQVWADSVIAQANNILPTAPIPQPLNLNNARVVMNNMYALGLAWQLTGNTNYAERAWTELSAVAAFTNGWYDQPLTSPTGTLLETAEMTHGFAIGYDWMYQYWSQTRRDTIRNAIITNGLNTALTLYQHNFWALRADSGSFNWSIVCNGGFATGALAVGTESTTLCEQILNYAMNSLRSNLVRFTTDQGAGEEGFTYLEYAQQYAARALAGLEWTLGSDFGLSDTHAISETAFVPIYTAGPSGLTFGAGDDSEQSPQRGYLSPWSARRFNQPLYTGWDNVSISGGPLDALWYADGGLTPAAAGAQPDMAFHGEAGTPFEPQENVVLRGNWSSNSTTFVAAKAGEIGASHGDLDAGTFVLDALGKRWFHFLGKNIYSLPIPHAGQYLYRGEGHNTFIVNPGLGPDMLTVVECPLVAYEARAGSSGSFAVYDVTAAHSGVTRAWRGFRLLNNRKEVLVQDEIQAASAKTVWWFAHYAYPANSVVLSPDGTAATLTQGSERLWCKIVTGGATFQIMDAAPLPTSPVYTNQPVEFNFKKLAIERTNVTSNTLAVWFVPLAPGDNPPTNLPAITPLNTWQLVVTNDPPTASSGVAYSTNGLPVDVDLRAFAADDWNTPDQLTYAVTNAQGGTVTLLTNGYIAHFMMTTGTPSFGFTVTDAGGLTSGVGTISITLSPVTTVWTNLSGGNWSTAANWLGNAAPVSGSVSAIKFFDGLSLSNVTVTANDDYSGTNMLSSLTMGGTGSGTVTVNLTNGPLDLVNNGIVGPTITLAAGGGTFTYNVRNALSFDNDVTINGVNAGTFQLLGNITGAGGLTRSGSSGTLVLAGNNTYAGPTLLSDGTTQLGNGGATGSLGLGDVEDDATLIINRNNAYVISNNISGSGSLIQEGSGGTTTLAGDNTFTGSVTVNTGTLKLISSTSLGVGPKSIFMEGSGHTLQLSGGVSLDNSISLYVSSNSGDGTGISSLDGTNVIDDPIYFTFGNPGLNISSATGQLTVAGNLTMITTARTLFLGGASTNANIIDGVIAETTNGVMPVVKQGAGTWILSATNTYTGNTTVNAGKFIVTGGLAGSVVVNGGTFRCNASIASNLTVAAAGALEVDFAGPTPGTGFDQVTLGNPASTLTLAGALNVVATGKLPFNTPFMIINNPGSVAVSGTFAGLPQNVTFAASGYNWQISYTGGNGNEVTLTALSALAPIPGAPTNLTATAVNYHQIKLNWVDTATNEIGFSIERSAGSDMNFAPIATVAAGITSFADTNAQANTTCFYRVQSFASVAAWSAYSAEAYARTFAAPHIGYQARIVFTNYPRAEVLTNFPVLVVLGTNVPGFDYTTFLTPDGSDLRFWSSDRSTALNYEIENWNPDGQSAVWLQVPLFTNGCSVLVSWGDPAAVNPVASSTNGATWSQGFLSVWHLGETATAADGTAQPHLDSSPNQLVSQLVSVTQQGTASGVAGGCDNFNGVSDYVALPNMGTNPTVTVECWANLNATPTNSLNGLVSSDPWSAGITALRVNNSLQLQTATYGGGSIATAANSVPVGQWFYAGYVMAGTGANNFRLYLNGANLTNGTGIAQNDNSAMNIAREYGGRFLNARVDEVRVSSVARSSNWLWATYQNIASNSVFNSYGSAAMLASNLPPSLAVISNRTGSVGIWLSVTNSASDPDVPAQQLIFSLVNPPAGAAVNATNGVFTWRPTAASAGSAQPITLAVADNGTPSLSATQSFNVLVNPVAKPSLAQAKFTNGGFRLNITGDTGPDYTVQGSTNLSYWSSLFTTNSPTVPFSWMDAGVTNFSKRFYRVMLGP